MFRLFAGLNQCRHIYFAGCHDAGYLSLLTPYKGRSDFITLLKAASFHKDFETLGLPIKELPSVFMSTRLDASNPTVAAKNEPTASGLAVKRPLCETFQKVLSLPSSRLAWLLTELQALRESNDDSIDERTRPDPVLTNKEDASDNSHVTSPGVGHPEDYITANLPQRSSMTERYIPINKFGERLDFFCPRPTENSFEEYRHRTEQQKVCNSYHLSGKCSKKDCQYGHGSVSESVIEVLRYMMIQYPCSRLGACRSISCFFGHLCQKPGCNAVGKRQCRFIQHAHTLDLQVMKWVAPDEEISMKSHTSPPGESGTR